jgi:phosphotransferase system HPr (HPr) family protein
VTATEVRQDVRQLVDVDGPAGLHARPAAALAETAARFRSVIRVRHGEREVDAKSVLLLLTLDVRQGDSIEISADGPDAQDAVDALSALVHPS